MISLDFEQDEAYPQWAAAALNIDRGYFGNCSTISVWSGNEICAVVIYSSHNGINCEVTVAATSKWWLRKSTLNILMKYPFYQLGCQRITLLIRQDNALTQRACEKVGFEREGCLRNFYPDGSNCLIYGLLKSERIH